MSLTGDQPGECSSSDDYLPSSSSSMAHLVMIDKYGTIHTTPYGVLLTSVWPIALITCTYLAFVCYIGPRWLMANRAPFKLNTLLRVYNLTMVVAAAYVFALLYRTTGAQFFDCSTAWNMKDASVASIYGIGNTLIAIRVIEYLDTVFFTLRKKHQQVTFLHVFHHSFVPMYAYWILRTAPTRFNVFILFINSMIHVVMYSYYFASTFDTKQISSPLLSRIISYKRYMTQAQILQFVLLTIYTVWIYSQPNSCNVPTEYIGSNLALGLGFLALFVHFYLRTYRQQMSELQQRRKQASQQQSQTSINNKLGELGTHENNNHSNNNNNNNYCTTNDNNNTNEASIKRLNNRKYYNERSLFEKKFGTAAAQ